jgi:DNA-directed RNA polymerase specialized sigma24 family protein
MRIVGRRIPPDNVEDVVQDAFLKATAPARLPRQASMQAWLDAICRHTAADFLEQRRLEKEHIAPLPVSRKRKDEAGYDVEDDDDPLEDVDPANDPERDRSFNADAFMLRGWAEKHITDPEKRQTFALMCEWAEGDKTYADLARENGIRPAALVKRVERLKLEIAPSFNRYRNGMFMLFLLGGFVLVLAIAWLLSRESPARNIGPDPGYVPPASSSAAPAPTSDRAPLVAQPTQPSLPDGAVLDAGVRVRRNEDKPPAR